MAAKEQSLALVEHSQQVDQQIERVLIMGDIGKLDATQRLQYYNAVCKSLGLNPLTRPFDYITLNGKVQLYAKKDCTDQLRTIHGVSVEKVEHINQAELGIYVVTAVGKDDSGRYDTGTGAVNIAGLKGDALANAIMKAETKAKRRLTLSLCGLGLMDESELETIRELQEGPKFEELQERLEWIANCKDLDELKTVYLQAYADAKAVGDQAAMKQIVAAKEQQKKVLNGDSH